MSENKTNVPKIRFPGFTDAWEQRRLTEIINDIADGPFGSNLKTVHYTDEREARIIQLSNIGESGWQDENVRYTTFEHAKKIKRCIVQENELVMAKMMPAGLTIVRPNTDKMYVLSSDAVRIKLNDNLVDSKYFVSITKSNFFLNQINNDSQGSTRTRTSISKIKEMQISTPILQEQRKIGAFLSNLDNLITLHQRKLNHLRDQKKSLLQKMFPKNGEQFPEIRFPGFSDAWEQRRLSEVGDFVRANVDPQVTPDDSFVEYSMHSYDNGRNPETVIGNSMQSMRLKISGDVLLINKLNVRQKRIWLVKKAPSNAVASSEFMPFTSIEIDLAFLEQLMLSDETTRDLESISSGTSNSQKRITPSDVLKYLIKFPVARAEQEKIGSFFKNIDNLITLHQRKLDHLKDRKKALLQQMFV